MNKRERVVPGKGNRRVGQRFIDKSKCEVHKACKRVR